MPWRTRTSFDVQQRIGDGSRRACPVWTSFSSNPDDGVGTPNYSTMKLYSVPTLFAGVGAVSAVMFLTPAAPAAPFVSQRLRPKNPHFYTEIGGVTIPSTNLPKNLTGTQTAQILPDR